MFVQRGTSTLGEEFIDIEVRGASGFVEARLRGGVLEVSYMEGRDVIFQIAQIKSALGPKAFEVVKGYATGELLEKMKMPNYLRRFSGIFSARLGGNWSGQTVNEGAKTWLVVTKGPDASGGLFAVIQKQYWPFDVPPRDKRSPEGQRFVSFLESACHQNCKAYMMEESVVGAEAPGGRSGEVVRRGGGGRWWEIILAENQHVLQSKFVDGFEQAAEAVLSWLRGDPVESVLQGIRRFVVERPRGLSTEADSEHGGIVINHTDNVPAQNVSEGFV